MNFSLIAAVDEKGGIGKRGKLPWRLSKDLAFFQKTTIGDGYSAVIMGRTTWESIPVKRRPLEKRLNIVLTHNKEYPLPIGVLRAETFEKSLKKASESGCKKIFVIGGENVFMQAINHPDCITLLLTKVEGDFECDAFFPEFDKKIFVPQAHSEVMKERGIRFKFVKYQKKVS